MKIKEISLNNFAEYTNVTASLDPNINYLVGKNGSGKSTLGLTGVQAIFQGIAEKASGGNTPVMGERFRFIGPAGATSKNYIVLVDEQNGNAEIKISRKITKSGSELQIDAPEGYGQLDQDWLNSLFNIFLISPKRFIELNGKEQAKALGIDTKKFDNPIALLKKEYTEINAVYRSFGEIVEVEKVDKVDVTELQGKKKEIADKLNTKYLENKKANEVTKKNWEAACDAIDDECDKFNKAQHNLDDLLMEVNRARIVLQDAGYDGVEVERFIDSLGKPQEHKVSVQLYPDEPAYITELPDDAELIEIDQHIVDASETNNKALLYEQYLQKKEQKEAKESELKANKDKQSVTEAERLEYIKAFKFPYNNLTISEDGELLLNGKPIKNEYWSSGELLKIIPVLIATTNPELKYVYLQDFSLLDEDKAKEIEEFLTGKGFQLVLELVGKNKIEDKNCILLRDNCVVDNYEEIEKQEITV